MFITKIFTALLLSTSLVSTYAQAERNEDCDRPEYAKQYAIGFKGELNGALAKFKDQDKRHGAKVDGMKAALVKAGAWTDVEASAFIIKASMNDDDAKALETERKKTANDFQSQLLWLDDITAIARGNKAAELRVTCLYGPAVISKADVLYTVLERAWTLLESKIAAVTLAKKVTLP